MTDRSDDEDEERALARSWETNAQAWIRAVRGQAIESRTLVTDRAILDAIEALTPKRVLDLGCGEGWLVRALAARGIEALGVDASASLVAAATAASASGGRFSCSSYAELAACTPPELAGIDLVIANFSLLDRDLATPLRAAARVLDEAGSLLIQTLHPSAVEPPYRDGWRREDFAALASADSGAAWVAMPWYFRTLGSWVAELDRAGFAIAALDEPLHPRTERPASLLIHARPRPARDDLPHASPRASPG